MSDLRFCTCGHGRGQHAPYGDGDYCRITNCPCGRFTARLNGAHALEYSVELGHLVCRCGYGRGTLFAEMPRLAAVRLIDAHMVAEGGAA